MKRPVLTEWKAPEKLKDLPLGSTCSAMHLVSKNAGWRVFRPVIDKEKCVNCLRCFLLCPDGVIDKSGDKPEIDYDFCKGCGVCAHECPPKVIEMVKEEK